MNSKKNSFRGNYMRKYGIPFSTAKTERKNRRNNWGKQDWWFGGLMSRTR